MLISIVRPFFIQGRYTDKNIRPVLSQDYSQVEYILVDDGSTDGTVDIHKKHENTLARWGMLCQDFGLLPGYKHALAVLPSLY